LENGLIHTKEIIILTTIEVIDEFGIHGLSTREVAKRVGISEPGIFRHFKSKSTLLLAVLEHFSLYDEDVIHSIKVKYQDPTEAIYKFVETYALYYENYPAITAMMQSMDLLRKDPNLSDKVKTILLSRTLFLTDLIKQAQKLGKIDLGIDSKCLAITIIGIEREWCLNWRLSDFSFSLSEKILETLEMTLKAFHKD
jgi:AcrR family transcriptional regulator